MLTRVPLCTRVQPLFPGESGVDQLVEIIKVLGTPTREEIKAMNPNYTEFKFPQIKAHPWNKVRVPLCHTRFFSHDSCSYPRSVTEEEWSRCAIARANGWQTLGMNLSETPPSQKSWGVSQNIGESRIRLDTRLSTPPCSGPASHHAEAWCLWQESFFTT